MNLERWPIRFTLITIGAGCIAWNVEAEPCRAQVLRTSLPIHFDDRDAAMSLPSLAGGDAGVSPAAALEFGPFAPPPLPEPAKESASAPQPLKNERQKNESDNPQTKTPERPKPAARKSYLPEQKPISQISIDVSSKSKAGSSLRPESVAGTATEELLAVTAATADQMHLGWMTTPQRTSEQFAYKPLYFEEVNLERYGRSVGFWQPAVSTTRFFATVPLLPYKMAAHSPHRAYYWHWPYEAGVCAPPVRETFPLQPRAALVEAAVVTGGAFLIP